MGGFCLTIEKKTVIGHNGRVERACGGIGIHVRLRCVCLTAWRFESSHAHSWFAVGG